MEPVSYLRAFRRRWWVILLSVLLTVGGVLLISTGPGKHKLAGGSYQATTVLLDQGKRAGGYNSLNTIAYIGTLRPVAADAAKRLHYTGDPAELASTVTVKATNNAGIVSISAVSSDPAQAVKVSNAFTASLLQYLGEGAKKQQAHDVAIQKAQLAHLTAANASKTQIAKVQQKIIKIRSDKATSGLTVLQHATAAPVIAVTGKKGSGKGGAGGSSTKILQSTKVRLALALLLGLVLGAILALILERFDSRLRTSRSVSRATELPILAEIPTLPRSQRKGVAVAEHPLSKAANAFRILAAAVSSTISHDGPPTNGHGPTPSVILVTSAGNGEGKTTVVANLAAAYAEAGRSVIVMSCDLRRPGLHALFNVAEKPGLVQVLDPDFEVGETLGSVRQLTSVNHITVVAAGGENGKPGELLASPPMKALLAEARTLANVVIVDTTALLVASDAIPLLPLVDAVLVVARAGELRSPAAVAMGELLHRLKAPAPAIVMNGETEPSRGTPEPQRELELAGELR